MHRGEHAFVLLNKFPYASGTCSWRPYRHGVNFPELDEAEILEVHRLGARGLDALAAVYRPQGFNLGWNIGPAPPAPASSTTGTCTSCRAGAATRTSCRCSTT